MARALTDAVVDVRLIAVECVATSAATVPLLLERLRDVNERVRRAALLNLSQHVTLQQLSLADRLTLINAVTGEAPNQIPWFLSTHGGDFFYQDVGATNKRFRMYRVLWETNAP